MNNIYVLSSKRFLLFPFISLIFFLFLFSSFFFFRSPKTEASSFSLPFLPPQMVEEDVARFLSSFAEILSFVHRSLGRMYRVPRCGNAVCTEQRVTGRREDVVTLPRDRNRDLFCEESSLWLSIIQSWKSARSKLSSLNYRFSEIKRNILED